jgi:hypothetical protein
MVNLTLETSMWATPRSWRLGLRRPEIPRLPYSSDMFRSPMRLLDDYWMLIGCLLDDYWMIIGWLFPQNQKPWIQLKLWVQWLLVPLRDVRVTCTSPGAAEQHRRIIWWICWWLSTGSSKLKNTAKDPEDLLGPVRTCYL